MPGAPQQCCCGGDCPACVQVVFSGISVCSGCINVQSPSLDITATWSQDPNGTYIVPVTAAGNVCFSKTVLISNILTIEYWSSTDGSCTGTHPIAPVTLSLIIDFEMFTSSQNIIRANLGVSINGTHFFSSSVPAGGTPLGDPISNLNLICGLLGTPNVILATGGTATVTVPDPSLCICATSLDVTFSGFNTGLLDTCLSMLSYSYGVLVPSVGGSISIDGSYAVSAGLAYNVCGDCWYSRGIAAPITGGTMYVNGPSYGTPCTTPIFGWDSPGGYVYITMVKATQRICSVRCFFYTLPFGYYDTWIFRAEPTDYALGEPIPNSLNGGIGTVTVTAS